MNTRWYLLLLNILFLTPNGLSLNKKIETFSDFDTPEKQSATLRGDLSYGTHTPITIASQGTYYLTDALQASAGMPALIIQTDKVTIDFGGNVIAGDIQITNNRTMIVLKNGTLTGSIIATNVSRLSLQALTILNAQTALAISGTAEKLLIENSTLSNYTTSGISIATVEGAQILNCSFIGTATGTGIEVQAGNGLTVHACSFKDHNYGIYLGSATALTEIHIDGCLISTSSLAGITLVNCASAEILNSEISRLIDPYFDGAGIDIQSSSRVLVSQCFVSGFFRGIRTQSGSAGFTIQGCTIEGNIRGICTASGVQGAIKECVLQNNGSTKAYGCGILDSTGPSTKVWYVSNIAMDNGDRPAATASRYDTNYCTGVDTPAATLSGIQPANGSSLGGNTNAPFYQLIKDQGGGGGGSIVVLLGGSIKGCIGNWDNITAALT